VTKKSSLKLRYLPLTCEYVKETTCPRDEMALNTPDACFALTDRPKIYNRLYVNVIS
jgi:hypothetical protein